MPETTTTIRILLADDHPVVRDGLQAILSTQTDFCVVGEAADGHDVLDFVQHHAVDVLLLDLEMPRLDGLDTIRRLRNGHPGLGIIVFTVFDTDDRILAAIKAGARGYLLKGAPREEIFQAIRVVHAGDSLLQPPVASRLIRNFSEGTEHLTARESEVLAALAQGATNKQIAAALGISERTVKFHVSAILSKLGAANRTEALRIATRRGLIG